MSILVISDFLFPLLLPLGESLVVVRLRNHREVVSVIEGQTP
jgi:hypothetical protein